MSGNYHYHIRLLSWPDVLKQISFFVSKIGPCNCNHFGTGEQPIIIMAYQCLIILETLLLKVKKTGIE